MRPQLFWGGVLVLLTGIGFYYVLYLYIGIPLAAGGAVMTVASFLLPEGPGPVTPSPGFKFCVFCSTQMPASSERCPHCNGLQPREG